MRKLLGIVTVVALAGPVLVTAVRFVHTGQRLPILLASFSAYTVLGFLLVLVVAALGLAVQGWSLAPLLTGGSAGKPDLTVMTSNLEFGEGDAVTVVRTVAEDEVDVLVLEEVTPAAYDALLADLRLSKP